MSTKPRILLLDEPHPKAKAIMEEVAECDFKREGEACKWNPEQYTGIYTQLKHVWENIAEFFPYLKFIATPCTGTDHIQTKGIKVIHLDQHWKENEGREVTSTAEHTMSLILRLAKLNRMQLKNKTLGIIGMGRIGQQMFQYGTCFGMKIILNDKKYEIDNLKKLLKESDIVTLHIPLEGNEGFIGEKEFTMMNSGALLVNTSRAGIIDEEALIYALRENRIGGYADDFYEDHHIWFSTHGLPNVIMTRHIGGNCLEAREATDLYISKKIKEYIQGGFQ